MSEHKDEVPHYSNATLEDLPALARDTRVHVNMAENAMTRALNRSDKMSELIEGAICPKTGEFPCRCPEESPPEQQHPLPDVPSNFDTAPLYDVRRPAPDNGADPVGAFRMIVPPSHLGRMDAIVYPGQDEAGHGHEFFGNTLTDGHSTYQSLRTTGDSTANNKLNRSAYWVPWTEMDGHVLMSDFATVYYKQRPASDPKIAEWGVKPLQLPNGLRWIAGHTMDGGPVTGNPHVKSNVNKKTYQSVEALLADTPRELIEVIYFAVSGPSFWNGKDLDSEDHRSHVSHSPVPGWVLLPRIDWIVRKSIRPEDDLTKLRLSSDEMAGTPRGGSFHMDFMEAWDKDAKEAMMANAINRHLNCSSGDFGNETGMKHQHWGTIRANPRLVPLPPSNHHH